MGADKKRDGGMFNLSKPSHSKEEHNETRNNIDKLIKLQAELLTQRYKNSCLDAKQLQEVLNVGESNVYELLGNGSLPVLPLKGRKVVSVVNVAEFIVKGNSQFSH